VPHNQPAICDRISASSTVIESCDALSAATAVETFANAKTANASRRNWGGFHHDSEAINCVLAQERDRSALPRKLSAAVSLWLL
jgi:hypothetical protein